MSTSLIVNQQTWATLKEQAAMAVKSGLLPKSIDTAEKAAIIALKGLEMNIPPMQAFAHINVINGKPAQSSELMLSQIYKNCPGAVVNVLENTADKAVIEAKRPKGKFSKFSFTKEEAATAELLGKGSWKQYPKTMLLWRAIAQMARVTFPDCLAGVSHTPEELGADVNEDGEVIEATVVADPPPGKTSGSANPEAGKSSISDAPPGQEVYTGTEEQLRRLTVSLKAKKVDPMKWDDVAAKLLNKPITSQNFAAAVHEVGAQ